MRKQKRIVNIGGVKIGGDNPVAIQSMCNTDTRDVKYMNLKMQAAR